jgi:hypothetical protein
MENLPGYIYVHYFARFLAHYARVPGVLRTGLADGGVLQTAMFLICRPQGNCPGAACQA